MEAIGCKVYYTSNHAFVGRTRNAEGNSIKTSHPLTLVSILESRQRNMLIEPFVRM